MTNGRHRRGLAAVLAVCALLAVAGVIITRWSSFDGFGTEILPVDGERALAHTRNGAGGPDRLELVDRHGKRRWRVELPAGDSDDLARFDDYAIQGGRLAIVAGDRTRPQTLSYDLASGRRAWAVRESSPHAYNSATPSVLTDGRRVFRLLATSPEARVDGTLPDAIVAREATTGRLLWRWGPGERIQAVRLARRTLVVSGLSGHVHLIDVASGRSRRLRASNPCVLDDAVLYTRRGVLRRHALAGHADTVLTRVLDPRTPQDVTLGELCGRRGGEIVVAIEVAYKRSAILGLSASGRRVAWRIDLGSRSVTLLGPIGEPSPYPAAHPLAGRLDRFVPILADPITSIHLDLLVLDLDRRRIAWKNRSSGRFDLGFVMRHRGGAYAAGGTVDTTVVRVDPATGRRIAAVQLEVDPEATAHLSRILPASFAGGRIWLSGDRDGKHDTIVLDATTLKPLRAPDWLRVRAVTL